MNRRLFLAGASAGSALCAGTLATSADAKASAIVFYDRRYAASRRFAAERGRHGAAACAVQPDALGVWRAIMPTLSHRPIQLDGMTTDSDFIVLRDCARAAGLKLVTSKIHDGRWSAETTLFSWRFA